MVLLKHIKKQLNQLVMPDIEALPPSALDLYSKASRNNEPPSPDEFVDKEIPSFQETFKGAYSHGLEEIYALQDVDVTKIKTIGSQKAPKEQETKEVCSRYSLPPSQQFELGFEGEFCSTLDSFILYEPISVLNLSAHAEKYLRQHGKSVIGEIVDEDWTAFSMSKGAGQGHIDEIKEKLKQYIAGRPLKCCNTVDFEAFLRTLIPEVDGTKQYLLLERYDLCHLLTLTPSENVEVRRLSTKQRDGFVQESLKHFRTEEKRAFCHSSLQKITDVFIKPWLRGRLGFCRRFELLDRLEQVSESFAAMHQVIRFLSDVYCEGGFPFSQWLPVVDTDIFCVDDLVCNNYSRVENASMSYFYKTDITYNLPELLSWLSREHAVCWTGFPDGFLEKVLRTSKHFHVTKNDKGSLIVRLA